ncbi:MAG: histidine ammonia-lyase [Acidobacteria bacterium]|nr:histidine ammonia-lyase [Acidobacteriota bacterium]
MDTSLMLQARYYTGIVPSTSILNPSNLDQFIGNLTFRREGDQDKITTAMGNPAALTGTNLSPELLHDIAHRRDVSLSVHAAALEGIRQSRLVVESTVSKLDAVYGINTGFGKLSDVRIAPEDVDKLQINLIRSHACGVGDALPLDVVRAMLAIRANSLIRGCSGVRLEIIEALINCLNRDLIPEVPSRGSVGASGDLAPSAHLVVLALMGEGHVYCQGRRLPAPDGLAEAGIMPLQLSAKEGLALLNGTQGIGALGALGVVGALRLTNAADIAGAFSLEVLMGSTRAFDSDLLALRPYQGPQITAVNVLRLTRNSKIVESHKNCGRIQDAYSLRCMPQVHGAVRDILGHVHQVVTVEINSATDNPVILPARSEILSGGNFHGAPIAMALDYLTIALTVLSTISERRIERLVNPDLSGLPSFLAQDPGIGSGFMMNQVVAAALASENKVHSFPASVDSIPTSGNKEDHVSMGMYSGLKLHTVLKNTRLVIANELLCAAQALNFLHPLTPGEGIQQFYSWMRQDVPFLAADQSTALYVNWLEKQIKEGALERFLRG